MKRKALLWFRNNLRAHDNEMLSWASSYQHQAFALFFVPKVSSEKQKYFYLKSAEELQKKLAQKNISLFLIQGRPEVEITKWAELNSVDVVLTQDSFNFRGQEVLNRVEAKLKNRQFIRFRDQTLIDTQKLPFAISD